VTPTEALAELGLAIEAALPAQYDGTPVYVNPLDQVETPCVMLLGGEMATADLGGGIDYEARAIVLGYRLDVEGGHTLIDDLTIYAIRAACIALSPAGWNGAQAPSSYNVGGVDYLGRESTVHIRFDPIGGP